MLQNVDKEMWQVYKVKLLLIRKLFFIFIYKEFKSAIITNVWGRLIKKEM